MRHYAYHIFLILYVPQNFFSTFKKSAHHQRLPVRRIRPAGRLPAEKLSENSAQIKNPAASIKKTAGIFHFSYKAFSRR